MKVRQKRQKIGEDHPWSKKDNLPPRCVSVYVYRPDYKTGGRIPSAADWKWYFRQFPFPFPIILERGHDQQ